MPAKKSPKKPSFVIDTGTGRCKVRAIRGPDDRGWYWRAELSTPGVGRQTVWTGWATRADASRIVAGKVADGSLAAPRPKAPAAPTMLVETVADLLAVWLDAQAVRAEHGQIAGSTGTVYRTTVARLNAGDLAAVRLDRVTVATAQRYIDARLAAGSAPRTLQLDATVFRAAWTWGRERGYCPDRSFKFPSVRVADVARFTPTRAEWNRVRALLPEGWARDVLTVQGILGCRIGALGKLRAGDVNAERAEVTIAHKGKTRRVTVPPDALTILRRHAPEGTDPERRVFVAAGEQTMRRVLGKRYLAPACKAAGLPYFTPHALRRMVEHDLASEGVPIQTFAAILGHSPAVALKAYSAVRSQDMRAAFAQAGIGGETDDGKVVPLRRRA